ncbi:HAAS domain-containing protein [Heyndrickxia ginsengihumi]|uniref:HAAS transmembrane region domain-containing protein n=1 Tax=Heyndrickxia ginsengihumi TaxID=363870 RepID=A0A0A6Y0P2_9BACI|nr:hypothetical protein [Heyndrickxia ginsengihumi]KHD85857.1 hypothetical protein NG54_06855 [Heyndrickxia ginsengihumi]MBE6185010.1 hypothetical protein [Bacillus sp. (in: firmicutes)]MCM3023959.1 hypothetical protein [Heyndrickxia ginsengihumi]NEY21231.1 hypothetical protein [Heyndrickxia ginsengihumi]
MKLSVKSQDFLERLRLYLISSGKNEKEVKELVEELEDHLYEAEKQGKNIGEIIGKSPKDYMEQLANEMSFDLIGFLKYVPIIIFGALAYMIMDDALKGNLAYSILQLSGYPVLFILLMLIIAFSFRRLAATKMSRIKEMLIIILLAFMQIAVFIGFIYVNKVVETPMIYFGTIGKIVMIILSLIFFITVSFWIKAWFPIMILIILIVPEMIIRATNLQESTKLFMTSISMPICFGIYSVITIIDSRKKKNKHHSIS